MPRIGIGLLAFCTGMLFLLHAGGLPAAERAPSTGTGVSDGAEEAFRFAASLMADRQEYDLAAPRLAAFVEAYPRHPKAPLALSYLAFCHVRMDQDAKAAEVYARLVEAYPEAEASLREDALALGGDAAVRAGRYGDAIRLYSELLRQFPRSAAAEAALYWRAESRVRHGARLAASGDTGADEVRGEAFRDYVDFEVRFPESRLRPGAVFGAGSVAMERGDYDNAVDRFQTFLRLYPEDARALEARLRMADAQYWSGAHARAAAGYEAVLNAEPERAFATAAAEGLAWCDYATGRIAQAAAGFERAASLQADPAAGLRVRFDAGNAYREAGLPRQAREQYGLVAESGDGRMRAQAHLRLGELAREEAGAATGEARQRFLREAAEVLRKAAADAALGEEAAVAGVYLGEVLVELGDFPGAAAALRRVSEEWAQHAFAPYALYHLALAESGRGDAEAAAEAIRQLLARFPGSSLRLQAAFLMAGLQAERGEAERSRGAYLWIADEGEAWAEAYRTPEGEAVPALQAEARMLAAQALFRVAEAAQAAGQTTEAAGYFRRLIETYPDDTHVPGAWLRLAGLAAGSGAYGDAIRAYEGALRAGGAAAADAARPGGEAMRRHAMYRLGVMHTLRAQASGGEAEQAARFREALGVLDAFRAAYGSDPEAAALCAAVDYYRGEVFAGLGRWDDAVAAYRASYDASPEGVLADAAVFGWGWVLRGMGEAGEAERQFTRLLQRFPESAYRGDAFFARSVLRRGREAYVEALADLEQTLAMETEAGLRVRARLERGRILDLKGRHDDAIVALKALADDPGAGESPHHPEILHALSWALWHKAEPLLEAAKGSEQAFRAAVGGRGMDALAGSAREAAEAKETAWHTARDAAWAVEDKMADVLRTLVESYPDAPFVDACYLRLGEVAYDRGDFKTAQAMYAAALQASEARPGSDVPDKARFRMAWCLFRRMHGGDGAADAADTVPAQDVIAAFDAVARHHPESPLAPESLYRAAALAREGGDAAGALSRYNRVLGTGDADPVAGAVEGWIRQRSLYGRGVALLDLEQYGSAREAFRALLALEPGGDLAREAHWGVGQAALMLHAHGEAAEAFEAARAGGYAGEAAAKARLGTGWIAWQREDWETAREEFRKVDVFHGQWADVAAEALLYAARCSIALNEPERARTDLTRILDRYPRARVAAAARRLRLELDGSTDQTAAAEPPRE